MIAGATAALMVTIIRSTPVHVLRLVAAIPAYWVTRRSGVTTTGGVVVAFLALLLLVVPEPSAAPSSPLIPPVPSPSRGLIGRFPPIDPTTLEPRERVVQAISAMLRQPGTSSVALRGRAEIDLLKHSVRYHSKKGRDRKNKRNTKQQQSLKDSASSLHATTTEISRVA
jgi:hypothetical protein